MSEHTKVDPPYVKAALQLMANATQLVEYAAAFRNTNEELVAALKAALPIISDIAAPVGYAKETLDKIVAALAKAERISQKGE